jgi:hypothetical protein
VEKCGRARQAADYNIILRMRFACWITTATDTDSEYVILNCFSTATVVTRTRLNVTFIRTLPLLYSYDVCVVHIVHTFDNNIEKLWKRDPFLFRLFKCAYTVNFAVTGFMNAVSFAPTECSKRSTFHYIYCSHPLHCFITHEIYSYESYEFVKVSR